MDIKTLFKQYEDEYLKFNKVKIKLSERPDLHAFLFLDKLFPGERDIIRATGHDQIWLDIDDEQIETLTKNQILELLRCGVLYDEDEESLYMFV